MAKQNVDPDALAAKTFLVTMLGAILYIAVVFIFVIANNAKTTGEPADQEPTAAAVHAEGHGQ
jgi:hypothetical protein